MSDKTVPDGFELQYFGKVDDVIPVYKYKSLESGVRLVIAQVEGPIVSGYFCLATEAHDDDGLPHTLEHLIFMGSENYPYKGVLDLLANRCFASGTNAWTDTDHTCYTMTTAGSDGFLNLMPIYLDHILFPTLKESAYVTEVHHINGDGEDAGVVYCEMQAKENSGESRTHLEMLRSIYPEESGYRSETGGILRNLRESTSHEKVRSYFREFYRPENLYIIVAGMVEPQQVLGTFREFERKMASKKVERPSYVRPWQSLVADLSGSVERVVKYGSDEEELGMFTIAWRGPAAKEQVELAALMVLFEYLTDTAVSPVQRQFVELEDPYCSEVRYSVIENSVSCLYLHFENVPKEKLPEMKPRMLDLLRSLSEGNDQKIDIERMQAVIHRQLLNALSALESSPHDSIAFHVIGEFLYGNTKEDMNLRLNNVATFRQLGKEPASYWTGLLTKYFVDKPSVAILGEPSVALMTEMGEQETKRLSEQKEKLGQNGLTARQQLLDLAIAENELPAPQEMLTSVSVPDVASIHFHSLQPSSNYTFHDPAMKPCIQFPLDGVPVSFLLDDIKTNFVTMTVILDTSGISEELRRYLPLYVEVLDESPIVRDGVLISHEEVIKQLTADTVYHGASVGINGSRFSCGLFASAVDLSIKVEMERYVKGVQWLHDLLYAVKFDSDRLRIVANKMSSDVARMKRSGNKIASLLLGELCHKKGTNQYLTTMLRQHKFLTEIVQQLDSDPTYAQKLIDKMEALRTELCDPSRLRVHLSAHVERLISQSGVTEPAAIWSSIFLPSQYQQRPYRIQKALQRDSESFRAFPAAAAEANSSTSGDSSGTAAAAAADSLSVIAGVGSVESSYLYLVTPCLTDHKHADVPAILVYIQYLTQLEGPMWKQIRGLGLSYHYRMTLSVDCGMLYFTLQRSSQLVDAYSQAKKIIEEHLGDGVVFDPVSIESCKSSLIYEIIEEEKTAGEASRQSLFSSLRDIPHGYNRWIMERIPGVTSDDLKRVGSLYFSNLFSPQHSKLSICTHPTKVSETCAEFKKEFQRDLTVISSLDEGYLINM